ncbi:MAG: polysaccharide biosynthesis C-terminal domain-containing protein [Bacteroidia bacterium]|nr:polysaccharide biosynthesis C-terminal domain-containing protein [Bacteroidia bacterium]MBT8279219.1 polysaccharide biosynthesis C-terminal domain-containing protein [Bacteroidia bacterium]NND25715.1 oligosaccharide flippase family protein [Flavobacteriaceae bacterium]NNL32019.1 oligosaccharide flippase family protein [Flavobacteriaceae bacterium]
MKLIYKLVHSLKDSVIKKSLNVLVLRVLGAILQIAVLLIITNNAREELVGQYNYFNSTIILLGAITLLGMNTSFLQFSGRLDAKGEFNRIVSLYKKKIKLLSAMFLLFFGIYLLVSQVFQIAYFQEEDVAFVLNKVFIVLFPFTLTLLNLEVIRALDLLYTSEALRNVGRFGLLLIFVLALVYFNAIDYLLEAFIISFLLLSAYSTFLIVFKMRRLKTVKDAYNISYKEILKVSFPMSFSLISLLIMQSFDIYVLEKFFSFKTVAYYGIAIKISAVVGIILTSINATIAPQISKLFFADEMSNLRQVIKKATTLNVILTIPLILFLIIFSNYILSFFGSNYILAQQALYIILFGQIINALCGPVGLYLNMTGRQNLFQKVLLIALVINIVMNLVLIPKYEMIGAAISTAFSFTMWNLVGLFIAYKKDKVNLSIFGSFKS